MWHHLIFIKANPISEIQTYIVCEYGCVYEKRDRRENEGTSKKESNVLKLFIDTT